MMGAILAAEDLAADWERLQRDRQAILAWGRRAGRLQEVVLAYRFARRQGDGAAEARACAARVVAALDPSIAMPANHATVLLEWMETEHRHWFWRCCRDDHVL